MLFADVDANGDLQGWIVADLKTGRAPESKLKPEVERQLLLYRDILLSNNPNAPPVKTEGWYTENSTRYTAVRICHGKGSRGLGSDTTNRCTALKQHRDNLLWRFLRLESLVSTLVELEVANGTLGTEDFSDSVILLHHFDDRNGSGIAEICEPANAEGEQCQQAYRFRLILMEEEKRLCKSYSLQVIKAQFSLGVQ